MTADTSSDLALAQPGQDGPKRRQKPASRVASKRVRCVAEASRQISLNISPKRQGSTSVLASGPKPFSLHHPSARSNSKHAPPSGLRRDLEAGPSSLTRRNALRTTHLRTTHNAQRSRLSPSLLDRLRHPVFISRGASPELIRPTVGSRLLSCCMSSAAQSPLSHRLPVSAPLACPGKEKTSTVWKGRGRESETARNEQERGAAETSRRLNAAWSTIAIHPRLP
ncbi:hypothetical protein XA68_14333 [Ophiocordyceps unilateralis]|uniref:Uncharacterized protein n=1 Tax=Ophiocordyceps unilateralis TaxID=268505 RepID=A0A2A9PAM6_OPHUN|nr:hypothetical protein XA68_14333 [Ophiocordyceps unilateralis]